jgi:predicted nuclease of predicted toxin-antitoxin system
MKLLTDQDVYAATVQFLRGLGHDVATAAELGMSQAADTELLRVAHTDGRLLVTRDRDYGGLVFRQALEAGVLYLRVLPSTLQAVHVELGRVLELYREEELQGTFVVVEPGRHRLRRTVAEGPGESDDAGGSAKQPSE